MRIKGLLLFIVTFCASIFGEPVQLGTLNEVLQGLTQSKMRGNSLYTLPVCCGAKVDLLVTQEIYEEGGAIILSGFAVENPNSEFILRGNKEDVYGWIHFKETDVVYRYSTTAEGTVIVEKVPLSAILSVNTMTPPAASPQFIDTYDAFLQSEEMPDVIHIGAMPKGQTAKTLQSRPGSDKVIYLDVTSVSKTDADMLAYWQYQAGSLSMYDVNVTTSAAIYNATPASKRGKNNVHNESGQSYCYVHAFGTSQSCETYWQQNSRGAGLTGSHEVGHLLGVLDAGHTSHGTYFNGLAKFKWVPLMGNYWMANGWEPNALYQWQKGEFAGATSAAKQPFFDAQYAGKHLTLLPDDITKPTPLTFGTNGSLGIKNNFGRIGTNGDTDDFTFEITGTEGNVAITVKPIERMVMLDVHAQILNSAGTVVLEDNQIAIRSSKLTKTLPKGVYTLRVKGGAEGTPSDGFSNYGSVGYYGISGSVTGAVSINKAAPSQISKVMNIGTTPVFNNAQKEQGSIGIFTLQGRLIGETRFTALDHSPVIGGSSLTPGIYLYTVKGQETYLTGRFVVKQ